MAGRRVLITGVGSSVGSALARRLVQDPAFDYVAGLEVDPRRRADGVEYIETDIRDPALGSVLARTNVDTIVHNQIVRQPGPGMSRAAMHDVNVIGTLGLVTACERAKSLEAIVVRGSAGIYGAEPNAPQFFGEEMADMFPLRTTFQRDVGEIEAYFANFARRHPDVTCTMLRYQPSIGAGVDSQISRYLSAPVTPTYLGYDPRIQVVHPDDALEALVATVNTPVRGAVNVAGAGTIGLTRLIRLARRSSLPIAAPFFASATRGLRRLGVPDLSEDFARLLRWGRGVDTRRLARDVGFTPSRSTAAAVADYVAHSGEEAIS